MTEISDWHLVQYLTEIVNQTEAAETHCDNYMAALKDVGNGASLRAPIDQLFAAGQGILSAAAIVNQFLWIDTEPPKPREYEHFSDEQWAKLKLHAKARAKKLRKLLAAKDSSPLRARTVRNSLEHIDQRLDVRLLFGSTIFADRTVGPQNAIGVQNQDHTEINFRRIDPQTSEFWVLAHSASLGDLVDEMHRMSQIAQSTIRTLSPGGQPAMSSPAASYTRSNNVAE
ncbi:hypothetical protein [Paenarthrobacter sp. PH39-S1]|uniref:hypothetical protein n=1 Tax=Paenarthrobacter sp. PH39-S1 TaxID=3046204 RepID=UPI0024BAFA4B|nr:hypothetical protein [Paenarthrobacter sp. PH39-S1]MDJ0358403.1 hypothetical protein [Paenarthrobacter sp. PH39-S1]